MPLLLAGLALLWLSSLLLRGFLKANPAALSRQLRKAGGWLAFGFALVMLVRGELNVAFGAACMGGWLLGTGPGGPGSLFRATAGRAPSDRRARASVSRVRTSTVEMMLDRGTGAVVGQILAGARAGRTLDSLAETEVLDFYRWCVTVDPPGARLVETYLDRRFPTWREAFHRGRDAGSASAGPRGPGPTQMSERDAYEILGLAQGANRDEVTRAHRHMMKRYHPDHGGTTAMAAKVNEAKDVLMRRHP